VLGKHVMTTVPYLTPIAYILVRTLISSTLLLTLGRIYEGPVTFPRLFKQKAKEKSPQSGISMISIESGNSIGMTMSPSASTIESMCSSISITDKKMEDLPSTQSQQKQSSSHFHRPRVNKNNQVVTFTDQEERSEAHHKEVTVVHISQATSSICY